MLVPLCHYFFYISIKNAEAELGVDNQKIRVLPRQHMWMMECEWNHGLIIGYHRLFVNMFVDKHANNWYIYISFCNRRGWRLAWSHQAGDAPLRGEYFSARLQEELSWLLVVPKREWTAGTTTTASVSQDKRTTATADKPASRSTPFLTLSWARNRPRAAFLPHCSVPLTPRMIGSRSRVSDFEKTPPW